MSAGPIHRDTFLTLVVEKSGEVSIVFCRDFPKLKLVFFFVKLFSRKKSGWLDSGGEFIIFVLILRQEKRRTTTFVRQKPIGAIF